MKKYLTFCNMVNTCVIILVLNTVVMAVLLAALDGDQFTKAVIIIKFIKVQLWVMAVTLCVVWGRLAYTLVSDLRE